MNNKWSDRKILSTGFILVHAVLFLLVIGLRLLNTVLDRFHSPLAVKIICFIGAVIILFFYFARITAWFQFWSVRKAKEPLKLLNRARSLGLIPDSSDKRVEIVKKFSAYPAARFEAWEEYVDHLNSDYRQNLGAKNIEFRYNLRRTMLYLILNLVFIVMGAIVIDGSRKGYIGVPVIILGVYWLIRNLRKLLNRDPLFGISANGFSLPGNVQVKFSKVKHLYFDESEIKDEKLILKLTYEDAGSESDFQQDLFGLDTNPFEIREIISAHYEKAVPVTND